MTRIGFNINGQGKSVGDIVGLWHDAGKPSSLLVMASDGGAKAQAVHEATGCIVVARADWPDDTASYPDGLADIWKARKDRAPDVHWYYPNEPNPKDLKGFLQDTVTMMARLTAANIRFCIGNFAWANVLRYEDVQAGLWDNFIRAAHQFTQDGYGFIGGHEYTTGALPWGCAGWNPNAMRGVNLPGPGSWPTLADIRDSRENNWHLFRWVMLEARAVDIAVPEPWCNMLVTECFWDRCPDLPAALLDNLDSRSGRTGGVHGIRSTLPLFQLWWQDRTPAQAITLQLEWADQTYPDYVKGFHLFTVSNDPRWSDYDFEGVWPPR